MRLLHYPSFTYAIHFKDGNTYVREFDANMRYEDVSVKEMANKEYNISDLSNLIHDRVIWCERSLFKKNTYIRLRVPFEDRYFNTKDIDKITVVESYREVDKTTSIENIGGRLPYEEFLQFVFDKEQELKSVITSRR